MGDVHTISVFNSEQQRSFDLHVRKDRLFAFYDFLSRNRRPDAQTSPVPGLSWNAMLGLDAIFERRPKRFPVQDIVAFLSKDYVPHSSCPPVTPAEIEAALERFSALYPPDVSESA